MLRKLPPRKLCLLILSQLVLRLPIRRLLRNLSQNPNQKMIMAKWVR